MKKTEGQGVALPNVGSGHQHGAKLAPSNALATQIPITEEWLKAIGFKWSRIDRQPSQHWILWIGDALRKNGSLIDTEDLGIELAACWWPNQVGGIGGTEGQWFCWLRSDTARMYGRFIHVRHLHHQEEVIQLIEALSGQPWDPSNVIYGSMTTPERAARHRAEMDRLDRRMLRESSAWRDVEKDPSMAGALPEHLEAHEKAKGAKP